jgi:UDP-N-acetylglucosamine acyltransferase
MASGNSAEPHGINSEGLKRRGFSVEAIEAIRRAYKQLYKSGLPLEEAKATLRDQAVTCKELEIFVKFLDSSTRSIIR